MYFLIFTLFNSFNKLPLCFSLIDEIVLSYVVSILEELGAEPSGDVEDVFDAEGFCEMMGAYVPEFSRISLPNVCQWMFELEAKLRQTRGRSKFKIKSFFC